MNRTIALIAAIGLCAAGTVHALYRLMNKGDWPASWPKELEPLRKQARTLVGPEVELRHFGIPFTKREEMEAAWPHLLKVKTKGAPVFLVRCPSFFLSEGAKAGVVVHCPPVGNAGNPATPEAPTQSSNMRGRWMNTTYIELLVDGEIVDLNRLPLPADTPIVDERFKDAKSK